MACRLASAKPLSEPMLKYFDWTPENEIQWNFNRNLSIFIQGNAFQDVVWKMAASLSRPQCVKLNINWDVIKYRSSKYCNSPQISSKFPLYHIDFSIHQFSIRTSFTHFYTRMMSLLFPLLVMMEWTPLIAINQQHPSVMAYKSIWKESL